ncbi:MAG TPA: hypothetical protein VLG38_07070 [Gammaproteobacteria bacterium]|nr:hypothetical protein [Gammaproteobacteria bacterium]
MKKLFWLLITLSVVGCSDRSSLQTYNESGRIDQGLVSRYQETGSPTEEYVNRVAKRIILVTDRPDNNYNFHVVISADPTLTIDRETNTITISQGALQQLKDEAELDATLTLSMERLENATNEDQTTATTLANAGYDPEAMLDLQEQYLYAAHSQNETWMRDLFATPPTSSSITENKTMLKKMPKGLLRGADTYHLQING